MLRYDLKLSDILRIRKMGTILKGKDNIQKQLQNNPDTGMGIQMPQQLSNNAHWAKRKIGLQWIIMRKKINREIIKRKKWKF